MPTAAAVEVAHQAAAVALGVHSRRAQLTAWAVHIAGEGLEGQRMAGH